MDRGGYDDFFRAAHGAAAGGVRTPFDYQRRLAVELSPSAQEAGRVPGKSELPLTIKENE